jgi:hypothetical protein
MSSEALYLLSTRIRQMDRGDTTQGLGNPGENIDSYFHPLPGSLSPRQTWQAIEVAGKFASILGNGKAIWRIRDQMWYRDWRDLVRICYENAQRRRCRSTAR